MKNNYRDTSLQASERSSPAVNQSVFPGVRSVARVLPGFVLAMALMAPFGTARAAGPAPIDLKSCTNFTLLAYSTITCTGAGTIYGDVGLFPAGAIDLGTPPTTVIGSVYNGGSIAEQAQSDLNDAFIAASPAALPGGIDVGAELGGLTLVPGIYQSPSGAYDITLVDLTLNGGPNDVWVFQMASTLTVGTGRQVILTGGAQARNIFWQVGSSASLLASSVFKGTIMASASVSMLASSTLDGRALARGGAVTFNGSSGSLPGPAKAITPFPTNGALAQSISTNLFWTDGGGAISYDVYFGTTNVPGAPELQGNQTNRTFEPGELAYDTTYYWRIDAKNTASTTEGDIWSFTTEEEPPGILQLTSTNYSVNENGGSVTVTVSRTNGSTGAASVDYTTADGTATSGVHYTSAGGTLNWGDGDGTSKTFAVSITDDAIYDGDKTFTVIISNAVGALPGTPATSTVTIVENETPEEGTLQFESATYTVNEDGTSIVLRVTRQDGDTGAASVDYATTDGSAVAGLDYTAASGTLNWGDGDVGTKSFTVTILDNSAVEWNKTFSATLANAGGAILGSPLLTTVTIVETDTNVPPQELVYLDFDGDSIADVTVYWAERGMWYILQSSTGIGRYQPWGWSEAQPVPGDYDGDLINDIGVYAPETGSWFIWLSASQSLRSYTWGWSEAQPVQADYDGDGLCDVAVYWAEQGMWYILQSSTGTGRIQSWGWWNTVPVPGDYDGDGQCDIAVYEDDNGFWSIWQSATQTARVQPWGWYPAEAVPGDYDGDQKTDVGVYWAEQGCWSIWCSFSQPVFAAFWGWSEAMAVPADYDGDGRFDLTVYAPLRGEWYIWQSGSGTIRIQPWGWDQAESVNQ